MLLVIIALGLIKMAFNVNKVRLETSMSKNTFGGCYSGSNKEIMRCLSFFIPEKSKKNRSLDYIFFDSSSEKRIELSADVDDLGFIVFNREKYNFLPLGKGSCAFSAIGFIFDNENAYLSSENPTASLYCRYGVSDYWALYPRTSSVESIKREIGGATIR